MPCVFSCFGQLFFFFFTFLLLSACIHLVDVCYSASVCVCEISSWRSAPWLLLPGQQRCREVSATPTPAPLTYRHTHMQAHNELWVGDFSSPLLSSLPVLFWLFLFVLLSVFLSLVSSPSSPQQQPGQLRNGSWKGSNYSFARHTRLLLASTHYYLSGILQWGARPTIHCNPLHYCQPHCFFSLSGCLRWWGPDCKAW